MEDQSTASLFQLSKLSDSPQKRRGDHTEEEDACDRRCFEEHAGAEDSEEEDKVQVADNKERFPTDNDVNHSREHEEVAQLNDFAFVKNEPNMNEAFCHGAPNGWKPPAEPPKDWKPNARRAQQ